MRNPLICRHRSSSLFWRAWPPLLVGLVVACGDDDAPPRARDQTPGTSGSRAEDGGRSSSGGAGADLGGAGGEAGREAHDGGGELGGAAGWSGFSAAGAAMAGEGASGATSDCGPELTAASIALSAGHVDVMSLSLDCRGELVVSTKDDTAPLAAVLRAADSVLIHGGPAAALEVPPDLPPEYAFLGPAGSTVWLLPEVQLEAVVWPGWNLAGVPAGVYDEDRLTLRLDSVSGPGRFVGYHSDFVPNIVFDLEQGLDEVQITPGSHAHLEWFFSAPGLYELTFTLEASVHGGAHAISKQTRHRFFLGNLEELPSTEPTVLVIDGLQPAYAVGETLAVGARSFGAATSAEPTWLRQCVVDWDSRTLTPWQPIAIGAELAYDLGEGDGGCQFRAVLLEDGEERVTSQTFLVSF